MSIFDYFKDKKFTSALTDFDKTIADMPYDGSTSSRDSDTHDVGDILSALNDSGDKGEPGSDAEDEISSIFKDLEIPRDRINRFHLYDSIYNNVQIVKRVITVYLNNTFLSNTINNKVYTMTSGDSLDDTDVDISKKFVTSFLAKNKLMNRLKHETVADMLIYGDSFIELIDLDDVVTEYPVNTEKSKTSNSKRGFDDLSYIQETDKSDVAFLEGLSSRADNLLETDIERLTTYFTNFETSPSISDQDSNNYTTIFQEGKGDNKDSKSSSNMDRLLLKFHPPIKLIPLESPYGIILGYLEIGSSSTQSSNTYNTMANFLNTVNTLGGSQSGRKKKSVSVGYSQLADALIRKIFKKFDIVKAKHGDVKKVRAEYIQSVESKIKPDLMYSIKKVLVAANKSNISNSKLNVRFIKPNRIFHFKYPGAKSVVDTLVYPGKMYLLIQLTNTISRISRSSAVRKWNLDIGSRENASAVIGNLRDSLKNQRITAADMTTRDISKVMTDFKDLITINRNGKSFVDVEMIQMGDPSISTQDLEFQRNELVAVSGIPASYLGYNDSYELRDQLVHANISFANEIIGIQSEVNENLNSLLSEAGLILGHNSIATDVSVSLTPPMILMLQVIESTMQSFSSIYGQLKDTMELKTDPVQMLDKFVPYADWKSILSAGRDYERRKKASQDPNDAGSSGGY